MSKKHYQALAAALYSERKYRGASATYEDAIRIVARVLAANNPRFDRDLFMEACETGKCRGMRQAA